MSAALGQVEITRINKDSLSDINPETNQAQADIAKYAVRLSYKYCAKSGVNTPAISSQIKAIFPLDGVSMDTDSSKSSSYE